MGSGMVVRILEEFDRMALQTAEGRRWILVGRDNNTELREED